MSLDLEAHCNDAGGQAMEAPAAAEGARVVCGRGDLAAAAVPAALLRRVLAAWGAPARQTRPPSGTARLVPGISAQLIKALRRPSTGVH